MMTEREKLIETRTHCMDLESDSTMVQSLDYSGSIIDVSPGWLNEMGYLKAEVLGRHFVEFLHISSICKVEDRFPHLKDYGCVTNVPLRMVRKDRTSLSVVLNGTSKYSDNGVFERTYCEIMPFE